MAFARIKNNEFVEWVDLYKEYPNISFPTNLTSQDLPKDIVLVNTNIPAPIPSTFEKLELATVPKFDEQYGSWILSRTITNMTEEEKSYKLERIKDMVRAERNRLLILSDWTQVADAPVNKQAWADYRQTLRNITSQQGFPLDIQWPVQPV